MIPKVAVLVADSHGETFATIKRAIHTKIWKFTESHEIDVFYMIGKIPNASEVKRAKISDDLRYTRFRPAQRAIDYGQLFGNKFKLPKVEHNSGTLHVDIPEGLRYLGVKYLSSLRFLHEQNYDIVYKTTLSSIVNPDKFVNFTSSLSLEEPLYAGTKITSPKYDFVSGANLFLNRKSIESILNKKIRWNHADLDDVAVAKMLKNVEIISLPSLNISSIEEARLVTDAQVADTMHYRCRTTGPMRSDVEVMKVLYTRISGEQWN